MQSSDFQIVIPMTGSGSRFVAAGYPDLKPLIKVWGRPMVDWVVNGIMPDEKDVLLICRGEHLKTISGMAQTLKAAVPQARVFSVEDWSKKGPIYNIMHAQHLIDDNRPVVVSYCDYFQLWDWQQFKKDVIARGCDGALPCYTGFHPHLMPPQNLYASCRVDADQNLLEIREKFSFEADKAKALHSPGIFYFKTGALLKKYAQKQIDDDVSLNGEYYASLTYNAMVADGLKIWVPPNVKYFCQWGTPEDLQDFLFWTQTIKDMKP